MERSDAAIGPGCSFGTIVRAVNQNRILGQSKIVEFLENSPDEAVMLDALFIWSGLHGLASIAASSTVATLEITPPVLARSGMHLLQRLSQAMDTPK
jgi:hypothetical protein